MPDRCKKWLRNILIVIMIFLTTGSSALAASISVTINKANTRVYQKASTSSKYVKVKKGLKVTLKSYSNGWGKVTYKGKTGYVQLKYLNRVKPVKAYTSKKCTLYKYASTSKKLRTLKKGETVYVVGVDGSYTRVQNKSGSVKGYIKTSCVTEKKPSTTSTSTSNTGSSSSTSASSSSSSKKPTMPDSVKSTTSKKGSTTESQIEYLIYVAQQQLGKPYSADANPPKNFDCAIFTHYCYDKINKGYIKSSAKTQGYDSRQEKIAYEDLKRGDLVCFNTDEKDSDLSDHVGIYLGKGYFIHASSAGKMVMVSSMSSGYYKRVFSWGRRLIT